MNIKNFLLYGISAVFYGNTLAQTQENIISELVILNINTGEEKTILKENRHFEAPNWSRDGKFLLINSRGLLEKIDLNGNKLGLLFPELIKNANNPKKKNSVRDFNFDRVLFFGFKNQILHPLFLY